MKQKLKLNRLSMVLIILLVLLQALSRYGLAPVADHVSDTWGQMYLALALPDAKAIWSLLSNEIDRPVAVGVTSVIYRIVEDHPAGYALCGAAGFSLLLSLYFMLIKRISGCVRIAFFSCAAFTLLPTLTESFHWGAMITAMYIHLFYVASIYCWTYYVETERKRWVFLASIFYLLAVASYEYGVALPLICLFFYPVQKWGEKWRTMLPFAAALTLYLGWRFTDGFGMADGIAFSSRQPNFQLWALKLNVLSILSWWAGGNFLDSVIYGWRGFSSYPAVERSALFLINLALTYYIFFKLRDLPSPHLSEKWKRIFRVGLIWWFSGHLVGLVAWTAPRLLVYPSLGACIVFGCLLARLPLKYSGAVLALLMLVLLPVNQGTALQWKQSGEINRKIYRALEDSRSEWEQADLILIQGKELFQIMSNGEGAVENRAPIEWAQYGNASLIRGFVPKNMLSLIVSSGEKPKVILDMECNPRFTENDLIWHRRFTPDEEYQTPRDKVYILNLFNLVNES